MRGTLLLLAMPALLWGCDDRSASAATQASAPRPPAASSSPPAASVASAPPPVAPAPPSRYPADRVQSPITKAVVAELREIALHNPSQRNDVFAKIGDSITASGDYLYCFSKHHRLHHVDLADHADLQATLQRFRGGNAAGRDPFFRESRAAVVGWSAWQMLRGSPTPIDVEVEKLHPRFAFVMFGTNDLEAHNPRGYADDMNDIVDHLIEGGTIPILFSIPPRLDKPSRDAWVPRYNGVVRGIATLHRIPFVDFHRALAGAPHHGLAKWGIHPSTYAGKLGFDACDFTAPGLEHGYNIRNLVSLEALDRASRALDKGVALDDPPPAPAGGGTAAEPQRATVLPFVGTPEAGKSTFYQVDLPRKQGVHVLTVAHHGAPPAIRVLRAAAPHAPVASGAGALALHLDAGSYLVEIAPAARARRPVVVITDEPDWAD